MLSSTPPLFAPKILKGPDNRSSKRNAESRSVNAEERSSTVIWKETTSGSSASMTDPGKSCIQAHGLSVYDFSVGFSVSEFSAGFSVSEFSAGLSVSDFSGEAQAYLAR